MSRIWKECIAPQYLHEQMGVYHGIWMPQMDRCWMSDDGFQVTTRLLRTAWGKVEHAAITIVGDSLTCNGEHEIPWSVKQSIKNELFGENRIAIEVFPAEKNKVDVMDVYHMWVLPKDFRMPFGIHPTRDEQNIAIKRGCPKDISRLAQNSMEISQIQKERAV